MAEEKQKTSEAGEKNIVENSKDSRKPENSAKKSSEKASVENETEKDAQKSLKAEEKPAKEKKKPRKAEAVVNSLDLPISMKEAVAICRFIKGKEIGRAIEDLELVAAGRKAVPMKGEIPHRKGKIMSGRFPKKSAINFIKALKSLSGNAIANGVENPAIAEAVSNYGQRQYGRFGSVKRKRTHLRMVARNTAAINQGVKR